MDKEIVKVDNSPEKVRFRQSVLALENQMKQWAEEKKLETIDFPVKHYFTPIEENFGSCLYGREIFIPKGSVIIGKLHKSPHISVMLKGKINIATEFGKKTFEAPYVMVSEGGMKRAAIAEEDTIWLTVHQTHYHGEDKLDEIEEELIAKTYEELGMISSTGKPVPVLIGDLICLCP